MSDDRFLLDNSGERIYVGDYVQCKARYYDSLKYNERRRVQAIQDGCLVLNNTTSPIGTSLFRADRFRLAGRYHGWHRNSKQETTTMIHIAVLWTPGLDMVAVINGVSHNSSTLLAGHTKEEIQERIRTRLSQYPDEKWLICSGNTIGERADPPVRFRSI